VQGPKQPGFADRSLQFILFPIRALVDCDGLAVPTDAEIPTIRLGDSLLVAGNSQNVFSWTHCEANHCKRDTSLGFGFLAVLQQVGMKVKQTRLCRRGGVLSKSCRPFNLRCNR
jgi:hypothetical protein